MKFLLHFESEGDGVFQSPESLGLALGSLTLISAEADTLTASLSSNSPLMDGDEPADARIAEGAWMSLWIADDATPNTPARRFFRGFASPPQRYCTPGASGFQITFKGPWAWAESCSYYYAPSALIAYRGANPHGYPRWENEPGLPYPPLSWRHNWEWLRASVDQHLGEAMLLASAVADSLPNPYFRARLNTTRLSYAANLRRLILQLPLWAARYSYDTTVAMPNAAPTLSLRGKQPVGTATMSLEMGEPPLISISSRRRHDLVAAALTIEGFDEVTNADAAWDVASTQARRSPSTGPAPRARRKVTLNSVVGDDVDFGSSQSYQAGLDNALESMSEVTDEASVVVLSMHIRPGDTIAVSGRALLVQEVSTNLLSGQQTAQCGVSPLWTMSNATEQFEAFSFNFGIQRRLSRFAPQHPPITPAA